MSDQIGTGEITSDDKLWALLSWILAPIVSIIILLMDDKKNRPFLKYNAVVSLTFSIIYIILGSILTFVVVGPCILGLGWIAAIYFGIKSYQGEYVKVPFLTDFVKNQGWA
jgi:uncharacterized membrane protein